MPDVVRRIFETLYTRAEVAGQYVAYDKLARLGLEFSLIDWAKVTFEAERLADQRVGGDYPMAVQGVWDLAAQGYAKLGDDDAKRRCQERSVDEALRVRERSEGHTSELQSLMSISYAICCLK